MSSAAHARGVKGLLLVFDFRSYDTRPSQQRERAYQRTRVPTTRVRLYLRTRVPSYPRL